MSSDLSPSALRNAAAAASERRDETEAVAVQIADDLEDALRDEIVRLRQQRPWWLTEEAVRAGVAMLAERLPQLAEELAMP